MLNRTIKLISPCVAALLLWCSPAQADDIQDANRLFKQKQYAEAMDKVDGILKTRPKDAQARFLKGLIQAEQGGTTDAIRTFTSLSEDYPELPEPYNNLAVLYASQEQYDKARVALEMAIRTHPSYATAYENLGDIYAKMASQAYDRALQQDRSNASTQTKLALINDLFGGGNRGGKPGTAHNVSSTIATTQPVTPIPVTPAKPAAQPETAAAKPVAKPSQASPTDDAARMVQAWAAAWSAKNVRDYLSFYADSFRPPNGEKRAAWEAQRNERINKPGKINISISDIKVDLTDDSHASVSFRQTYHASNMNSSTRKTLELVKSGGQWLIREERTGK